MLFHRVVGQFAVKKIQGVGEIVMNRVAVPAVMEAAKFGQEILGFPVSRKIFQALVIDRLSASELVDPNDQRAEILESPNRPQVQNDQTQGGQTEQGHGDLEVVVGEDRVAVLLQVE